MDPLGLYATSVNLGWLGLPVVCSICCFSYTLCRGCLTSSKGRTFRVFTFHFSSPIGEIKVMKPPSQEGLMKAI